jgi:tetratricopeptide (TPR) repeat protein
MRIRMELQAARTILEPLATSQPQMGAAWRELGLVLVGMGAQAAARSALLRCIDLSWREIDVWYVLGDLEAFPGAEIYHPESRGPRMVEAAKALRENRLAEAKAILRDELRDAHGEPVALKLLGDVQFRNKRWTEARRELEAALEAAPDYAAARFRLATMLFAHGEFKDSLLYIAELLRSDPGNILYRALRAIALGRSWQIEPAIAEFHSVLADNPAQPGLWLEYGGFLRATRQNGAADAFVKAIELLPSCVEAYAVLAGMKSFRFDEGWVQRIDAQLSRQDLAAEDRARLHFVLGKLFEDRARYQESFENYKRCNEILRQGLRYGAEASTHALRQAKQLFRPAFFRQRRGAGSREPGAIFLVGVPRSGSTLVEQILSSHSDIEGLGEIEDMNTVIAGLMDPERRGPPYPFLLGRLGPDRLRAAGERYMSLVKARRRTGRSHFTDKLLSNFFHVGLIHLILPEAKIIDVRRHPMDCGLSCYKHYFPFGQPLTYRLEDIGRAYADYVEMMAYFDEVLPGKVHRIIYEDLIENPDEEVRRLCAFLGLPFEEQCVRFHENKRLVRTLSYDQVQTPLYKEGKDQWRNYEPWLGPLKNELGYVLEIYPEVPKFYPHVSARLRTKLSLGPPSNPFDVVRGARQIPFEGVAQ